MTKSPGLMMVFSPSIVRIHPIAAITKGLEGRDLTEMGMLAEAGAVAFSDDGLPVANSLVMRRALSYATAFDALVIQHAEDPALSGCGCMNEGETATRLGLPGIPDASETVNPSVTSAAAAARLAGVIRLKAPSSSSGPHRPQFESSSIQ